MKIGIDIDDTIATSFEQVFIYSQKFDIEELQNSGNVQNYGKIEDHNYIEAMYPHWNDEQFKIFWNRYFKDVLINVNVKPCAQEIIQKLYDEGNEIYIITSRYEEENLEVEKNTKLWLQKNNIPYKELILNVQDKGSKAKELNLDLFIDDSIDHCKSLQKNEVKPLLMTSIMNQAVNIPEIERVYSWLQIYNKINTLKKSCS